MELFTLVVTSQYKSLFLSFPFFLKHSWYWNVSVAILYGIITSCAHVTTPLDEIGCPFKGVPAHPSNFFPTQIVSTTQKVQMAAGCSWAMWPWLLLTTFCFIMQGGEWSRSWRGLRYFGSWIYVERHFLYIEFWTKWNWIVTMDLVCWNIYLSICIPPSIPFQSRLALRCFQGFLGQGCSALPCTSYILCVTDSLCSFTLNISFVYVANKGDEQNNLKSWGKNGR